MWTLIRLTKFYRTHGMTWTHALRRALRTRPRVLLNDRSVR